MSLKEKLIKLKNELVKIDPKSELKTMLNSIKELQHMITDNWLYEYKKEGLLKFKFVPIRRINKQIGKYKTTILEIYLINNTLIEVNPVYSNTNSKFLLELYKVDNPMDKIIITRRHIIENEYEWIYYKSSCSDICFNFTKAELEKFIKNCL